MQAQYSGVYRDEFGVESITLQNDGQIIRLTIRGVAFTTTMLDDITVEGEYSAEQLAPLSLQGDTLTNFTLSFNMSIPVKIAQTRSEGILSITLLLSSSAHNRLQDNREELQLQLTIENNTYTTKGNHGSFENALIELQQQLPENIQIEMCLFCGLSDYSPYGNGLFGCLACFRGNKEDYYLVKTKSDLFRIWPTMTEFVQETYHCSDFESRAPNTGYRG